MERRNLFWVAGLALMGCQLVPAAKQGGPATEASFTPGPEPAVSASPWPERDRVIALSAAEVSSSDAVRGYSFDFAIRCRGSEIYLYLTNWQGHSNYPTDIWLVVFKIQLTTAPGVPYYFHHIWPAEVSEGAPPYARGYGPYSWIKRPEAAGPEPTWPPTDKNPLPSGGSMATPTPPAQGPS